MNARELIQFNDQMIAFHSLMKGDLKREVDEAKQALAALGSAQSIAGAQVALETSKNDFESYKASVTNVFNGIKAELSDKENDLNVALNEVKEKKQELSDLKKDVLAIKTQLENDKKVANDIFTSQQASQAVTAATLEKSKNELEKAYEGITEREFIVAKKLAAFKAAVL